MVNLDRFAGSSEEEDNDNEYDEDNHNKSRKKIRLQESTENQQQMVLKDDFKDADESYTRDDDIESKEDQDEGENEELLVSLDADDEEDSEVENDDNSSGSESEDVDEYTHNANSLVLSKKEGRGQAGMADAMSRILGIAGDNDEGGKRTRANKSKPKTTANNIVLSKTITPLQKRQQQEKQEEEALKNKQKQRRDRNLTAMHTPVSTLALAMNTSKQDTTHQSYNIVHHELELERVHRRVATRGVVALFNAITQHQHQKKQQAVTDPTTTNKSAQGKKPMTKYGFLELIKNSAKGGGDATDEVTTNTNHEEKRSMNSKVNLSKVDEMNRKKVDSKNKKGWNALKDDFMMNSKLKDWDKELSDDESIEDDDHVNGVDGDDDGFMDDDDDE
jgi:hypothetical protein